MGAAGLLPKPIRQLSEVSSTIQKGVAGAESIFEQLDEAPEVDNGAVERERVIGCRARCSSTTTTPDSVRDVCPSWSMSTRSVDCCSPKVFTVRVRMSGSGLSGFAVDQQATLRD